jgi:hypothetical protein
MKTNLVLLIGWLMLGVVLCRRLQGHVVCTSRLACTAFILSEITAWEPYSRLFPSLQNRNCYYILKANSVLIYTDIVM